METKHTPVAYLRFWAWRHAGSPDTGPDQDEGFEVCLPSEKGVDGSPAFPVYTHPAQQGMAPEALALAQRIANLNPNCAQIGAGMLTSLVSDAQAVLKKAGIE